MKQLIFMIAATALGTVGLFVWDPFFGVFVYYLFAVLRPQYLWEWSLPRGVEWSFYVAIATIIAAVCVKIGLISTGQRRDGTSFTGAWSKSHSIVMAFAGWVALTYVTAQNRVAADFVFREYAKIFLMFVVSTVLIRTPRQVWLLFIMIASALAYISYEVNFLYITLRYLGIWANGYGGLDNNGAGLMLAMGVPMCFFIWEGMQHWARWVYLLLIPVLIHAVLCTYSRGAMVSLIGTIPFVLLWSRRRGLLLAGLLVLGFGVIPVLAGSEIRARFFTIEKVDVDASAESRKASWNAAWRIALDHPLVGVGLRNSPLISKYYGADTAVENRVIHNQFLQIAADSGFPGVTLYVLCIVSVLWSNVRLRPRLKHQIDLESRQSYAMAGGVNCALILFCIGAVFLSLEVFELPYLLVLLGAQLGALYQQQQVAEDGGQYALARAHNQQANDGRVATMMPGTVQQLWS